MNSKFLKPYHDIDTSAESPPLQAQLQRKDRLKGQGLVETAIILPLLLLMLLGVFEVGWVLRSYLVLVNVNREATRFAARGVYLDLKEKADPTLVGYEKVVTHTIDALSNQLSLDFVNAQKNASIIVTYYSVEPKAFACPGDEDCSNFDCTRFVDPDHPDGFVTGENLHQIEYPLLIPPISLETHPDLPAWYQSANRVVAITNTVPITAYHFYQGPEDTVTGLSRINPAEQIAALRAQNNQLNCQLLKKKLPPTDNQVVIVENVYYQDQLVGFPIVTAFVPDPVPLYSHTAMRMTTNLRDTQTATNDATACELLPIMVPLSKVSGRNQGNQITIGFNNKQDIMPGNFAWVAWDSTTNKANITIEDDIIHPSNAGENYIDADPADPGDDAIDQLTDWLESHPGANISTGVRDELETHKDNETVLYFPVWNDLCGSNCDQHALSGANGRYRVYTYVAMKIKEVNLLGNNPSCGTDAGSESDKKCFKFEFSHMAPGVCPGNGH